MAKIAAALLATLVLIAALAAAGASGVLSIFGGEGSDGSQPSQTAISDIPPAYFVLYQQAASTCPGLDWTILAAIGKIETNHGRSTLPGVHSGANSAGAKGPMQFLQPTFDQVTAKHPLPHDTTAPSPYNPRDAIYTAAAYLCDSGARGGHHLTSAIYTYNRAGWLRR